MRRIAPTIINPPGRHPHHSHSPTPSSLPPSVIPTPSSPYSPTHVIPPLPPQHHSRTPSVIPAKAGISSCTAFDKTELKYYSGTMTTPRNHTPRRQTHARNIQAANRVTPRPQLSTVIPLPFARHPHEPMPNSPSAKFDRMRHNPTGYHTMQQKLVHARTRARQRRSSGFR